MSSYSEDFQRAVASQVDFIKKQVLLEVIQVAAVCDTYEEFKKAMFGKALEFMREFEADGTLKHGTVDKIIEEGKKD
jgi:hypothetical protein